MLRHEDGPTFLTQARASADPPYPASPGPPQPSYCPVRPALDHPSARLYPTATTDHPPAIKRMRVQGALLRCAPAAVSYRKLNSAQHGASSASTVRTRLS